MGHDKLNDESRCFICNKVITNDDIAEERVEMVTNPEQKKVFVCASHIGVAKEIEESNKS